MLADLPVPYLKDKLSTPAPGIQTVNTFAIIGITLDKHSRAFQMLPYPMRFADL